MKRITPKIFGLRIYPNTTKVEYGENGSPILSHGQISKRRNDLSELFCPMCGNWKNTFMAVDFATHQNEYGGNVDPIRELKQKYGPAMIQSYLKPQIAILNGGNFESWAPKEDIHGNAFIPIFSETPKEEIVANLFWNNEFKLTARTWPNELISFIHMWDDSYWQYFTKNEHELKTLIAAHRGKKSLKLYKAELEKEYPDPKTSELEEIR